MRWIVNISTWDPSDAEWQLLLSVLTEEEAAKVMRYKFRADQKRGLISRLLQRRGCCEAMGVKYSEVVIQRTKGGKPFMSNKPTAASTSAPNWNYNVSHEGDYVAYAAEPTAVCGIDVAAPEVVRSTKKPRPMEEQLKLMDRSFTAAELKVIRSAAPDEAKMEAFFRRFWSLKEAYTKGRGDGLGYEFNQCEFSLGAVVDGANGQPVQIASVKVGGKTLDQWGFYIQDLGGGHWVSVARGPPSDIVDAHGKFRATLASREVDMEPELSRPEPPFVCKDVADLVPDHVRDELRRIVAGSSNSALPPC